MDPLKIPLAAAEHATFDGVGVWDWSGSAHDEGAEAAEWFSAYLGKPSRLVRFKEGSVSQFRKIWCLHGPSFLSLLLIQRMLVLLNLLQVRKLDRPIPTMLKVTRSCSLMPSRF